MPAVTTVEERNLFATEAELVCCNACVFFCVTAATDSRLLGTLEYIPICPKTWLFHLAKYFAKRRGIRQFKLHMKGKAA